MGLSSSLEVRRWEEAPLIQEIFTLNNLMMRVADRVIASQGLTAARWMLIGALEQYDQPPTVSELSSDALLTIQNVSRMVRAMESEGWVERFTVPGEGRSVFVRLTDKALRMKERAHTECDALSSALLDGLTQADIESVRHVLDRMIGNMDRFERILQRNGVGGSSPRKANGSQA